jgi:hypothetical protein
MGPIFLRGEVSFSDGRNSIESRENISVGVTTNYRLRGQGVAGGWAEGGGGHGLSKQQLSSATSCVSVACSSLPADAERVKRMY